MNFLQFFPIFFSPKSRYFHQPPTDGVAVRNSPNFPPKNRSLGVFHHATDDLHLWCSIDPFGIGIRIFRPTLTCSVHRWRAASGVRWRREAFPPSGQSESSQSAPQQRPRLFHVISVPNCANCRVNPTTLRATGSRGWQMKRCRHQKLSFFLQKQCCTIYKQKKKTKNVPTFYKTVVDISTKISRIVATFFRYKTQRMNFTKLQRCIPLV